MRKTRGEEAHESTQVVSVPNLVWFCLFSRMLSGHLRRFEIPGAGAAGTDAAGAGTAAANAVAGMKGGAGGAPDEAAAELSSWSVGSEPAEAHPFFFLPSGT